MKYFIITLFLLISFFGISKPDEIKNGHWYTNLHLTNTYNLGFSSYFCKHGLLITTGNKMILLNDMIRSGNNIIIPFKVHNSELVITSVMDKEIKGYWHNKSKGPNYKIPFTSNRMKDKNEENKTIQKFAGRWELSMDNEKLIGEFEVKHNKIFGSFLSETGDYGYFEGGAKGDSIYLSSFDGSHAFLFSAHLKGDSLSGNFLSGNHYMNTIAGFKNESAKLRDPELITYAVDSSKISFNLLDINKKMYQFPTASNNDKITIIQIFGTWCPNCMDETSFLNEVYKKYKNDLEIIGIGFERGENDQDRLKHIQKFKSNFNVDYKLLLGGTADKKLAAKIFPMFNEIIAFPTLIFLDKNHKIIKIHTGFSGPATGQHYTSFTEEIYGFIENIISG